MSENALTTRGFTRIGMKIHNRLRELGQNQSWLASRMGVTPQQVSKWMRVDWLQPDTENALAEALQVPLSFWD